MSPTLPTHVNQSVFNAFEQRAEAHELFINVKDYPYAAAGNGTTDDTASIQAAIDAVTSSGVRCGAIIFFPVGTYKITAPIAITTKSGLILEGAGKTATVIQASGSGLSGLHMLKFSNSPHCLVKDMTILGQTTNRPLSAIAFLSTAADATTFGWSTKCAVRNVRIGESSSPCDYGVYMGGTQNSNNDFHSFRDVHVEYMTEGSFYVATASTQSMGHYFSNCFAIVSKVAMEGPSFNWYGGGVSLNTTADFQPGVGPTIISGCISEASARWVKSPSLPGVIGALTITGCRFSADNEAEADDDMILWQRAGPLTVTGCRFDTDDNRISKISLGATRDAFADIRLNVWNQPGADVSNTVTWNEVVSGAGYEGGVFRGAFENNIYVGSADENYASNNGARTGEAFIAGGSANPVRGKWKVGQRYYFLAPTAGGYLGKVCTTAGIAATAAWQALTVYAVGDRVSNDTGKVYECDTAGTSAGAGGPTGTGSNITDGSARWDYLGTEPVWKGFGAIQA